MRNESSALNLLFSGGLSRTVASHKLNRRSNRSHSVFTLHLQQRQRSGVSEKIAHSKLHLIDLAGSERLKKTMESADGSLGDEITRKESMAINQSLTFLEQCVVALGRKNASNVHIPYRQSKLTSILKDCLGANCNTVMIACIYGEATHLEETVSTLRLASRMMRVQNEASSVQTVDTAVLLKKQEKIIAALKQELLMHDALVERTGIVYDPYTPEQQAEVGDVVERFVSASERDEETVLDIRSYRQMLEICRQFKRKLLAARSAASRRPSLHRVDSASGQSGGSGGVREGAGQDNGGVLGGAGGLRAGGGKAIGFAVDNNRGFVLGEALADMRPPNGIDSVSVYSVRPAQGYGHGYGCGSSPSPPDSPNRSYKQSNNSRSLALDALSLGDAEDMSSLEMFVKEDDTGSQLFQTFVASKQTLRDNKAKMRSIVQAVNDAKAGIDRCTALMESKKAQQFNGKVAKGATGKGMREVVDEEEFRIAKELKEAKQAYRNAFEQLQKIQQQSEGMGKEQEELRERLLTARERWQKTQGSSPSRSPNRLFANALMGMESDKMDDQEAFDRLETERVMANDPDSLAFFSAQKTMRANITQTGANLRTMQHNKRYG